MLLALAACNGAQEGDLPAAYRTLPVPEERLASEAARDHGRGLFAAHCALCHGVAGDGRGVRRAFSEAPQDFTQPSWRRSTTPRRIFFVVREGKPGTAMASWKALPDDDLWDLVAYLSTLGGEAP